MADREAVGGEFTECFARHGAKMIGRARKLLDLAGIPKSMADAEDIVSTAFVAAWRHRDEIEDLSAYVYKVIRIEVDQLARRWARHVSLEEKHAADLGHCALRPMSADFSVLVDNRDAVHRAVRGLSVAQRTAVWATGALDYTRDETAILMNKHPGTVAQHRTRALVLLRASLVAVIVGVLTGLGLAVRGALQDTSPADDPGQDEGVPRLWSELWREPAVVAVIGVMILWALLMWRARRNEVSLLRSVLAYLRGARRRDAGHDQHWCLNCGVMTAHRPLTDAEAAQQTEVSCGEHPLVRCASPGCLRTRRLLDPRWWNVESDGGSMSAGRPDGSRRFVFTKDMAHFVFGCEGWARARSALPRRHWRLLKQVDSVGACPDTIMLGFPDDEVARVVWERVAVPLEQELSAVKGQTIRVLTVGATRQFREPRVPAMSAPRA